MQATGVVTVSTLLHKDLGERRGLLDPCQSGRDGHDHQRYYSMNEVYTSGRCIGPKRAYLLPNRSSSGHHPLHS
jgi:hypothetical protein